MARGGPATAQVEILDRDEVMREALRRESVEVLSHQLDVERREQRHYAVTEGVVATLIAGVFFGAAVWTKGR